MISSAEREKNNPLTLVLSPEGRGKFLLPLGEKVRMRGKSGDL
jgi:hypothetical protein